MFRCSRDVAMLPIVCLVLMALSACASDSGNEATPAPTPLAPMAGLPAQPAVIPNLNQQILGNWSASYPGGPYRVTIQTDPLLGRTNYIATRNPNRFRGGRSRARWDTPRQYYSQRRNESA